MIDVMRGAVLRSTGPFDLLPSVLALVTISILLVWLSAPRPQAGDLTAETNGCAVALPIERAIGARQ